MWGTVEDRNGALIESIALTGDHELYGHFMRRVVREWPVSCENALTDQALNKKAWLGHAACALALRVPEDVVREAWSHLTDEQQFLANGQAARAIQEWENAYRQGAELSESVGRPVLPDWYTRRRSGQAGIESASAHIQSRSASDSAQRSLFEVTGVLSLSSSESTYSGQHEKPDNES
jgi:hypothetical protein